MRDFYFLKPIATAIWILLIEFLIGCGVNSEFLSHDAYGIGMFVIGLPLIICLFIFHIIFFIATRSSENENRKLVAKYTLIAIIVSWPVIQIVSFFLG